MPHSISVHGKTFEKTTDSSILQKEVNRLAEQINKDYHGKDPVFIVVLNGAFMFASDLLQKYKGPCTIEFVKYASYSGTESSGEAKQLIGLKSSLKNKHVLIIEDIVDTGVTIQALCQMLEKECVAECRTASMFMKPEKYSGTIKIDYVGLEIPDHFVIGYGLDYDEKGRNLPHLYTLKN